MHEGRASVAEIEFPDPIVLRTVKLTPESLAADRPAGSIPKFTAVSGEISMNSCASNLRAPGLLDLKNTVRRFAKVDFGVVGDLIVARCLEPLLF